LDNEPLHNIRFEGAITEGVGKTDIVNEVLFPLQVIPPPVYCELTVTVELLIEVPVFVPVNGVIVPVPFEPIPTVELLFDHEYDVPVPVKLIARLVCPVQRDVLGTIFIAVVGFIVIGKLMAAPVQVNPLNCKVGLTVTKEDAVDVGLAFVVVNPGMFPLPLAISPIDVLAFDHAKLVFGTLLVI
jgi:hypothetical protein